MSKVIPFLEKIQQYKAHGKAFFSFLCGPLPFLPLLCMNPAETTVKGTQLILKFFGYLNALLKNALIRADQKT
jgi:hypothetical protein